MEHGIRFAGDSGMVALPGAFPTMCSHFLLRDKFMCRTRLRRLPDIFSALSGPTVYLCVHVYFVKTNWSFNRGHLILLTV